MKITQYQLLSETDDRGLHLPVGGINLVRT